VTFQIIDDLLDYVGNVDILGKDIGDDLREGKVTLPLYIAHRDGTAIEQKFLEKLITQESVSDANLTDALTILERTQAASKCLVFAEDYARKASESLDLLPESALKAPLTLLPKKLLTRLQ
jgi:octaprenyl-diphosphate synthase